MSEPAASWRTWWTAIMVGVAVGATIATVASVSATSTVGADATLEHKSAMDVVTERTPESAGAGALRTALEPCPRCPAAEPCPTETPCVAAQPCPPAAVCPVVSASNEDDGPPKYADFFQGAWHLEHEAPMDAFLEPVADQLVQATRVAFTPSFWFSVPSNEEDSLRFEILKTKKYYEGALTATLHHFFKHVYRTQDRPDALILFDVGCNAGWATFVAASLGARAVCVEPHPRLNPRLRTTRLLNGRLSDRVHFVFAGASDTPGALTLYTAAHFGGSTVIAGACRAGDAASGRCNRIDIVRLDDVVQSEGSPFRWPAKNDDTAAHSRFALPRTPPHEPWATGPPVFLKVDVEGLELEAFRGLHDLLASGRVHAVYFECSEEFYRKRGVRTLDIFTLLYSHNFRLAWLDKPDILARLWTNGQAFLPAEKLPTLMQYVQNQQVNMVLVLLGLLDKGVTITSADVAKATNP